jgi:hypothetical protein
MTSRYRSKQPAVATAARQCLLAANLVERGHLFLVLRAIARNFSIFEQTVGEDGLEIRTY